ncbi:D-alanine--D-alanine ligase [Luedemannella helvata]|uniref:D-alanine--D-alanine ligase n=1 Tax=Luedemannella helvata TaxID=349315 RepID=A0ABP4WHR7_9ACTN
MSDLDRVVVLAGGLSPERDVSLRSGHRIAEALRRVDVEVSVHDVDATLFAHLAADAGVVVFPVLHGVSGEDGTVREVLELAGVPYVGAAPQACRFAFDKPLAKAIVSRAGLRTPASVTLPRQVFHDLGAAALSRLILDKLGLPVFVKPRAGGSAFGVTAVRGRDELAEALMSCFGYHDEALIELAVSGTEITVGVLDLGGEPVALPAVEIVPDSGVYDYTARYTPGATEFFCPARLPAAVLAEAAHAALTAHRALGLRDLSRTDMIVDRDGRVHVLETNVAPGMTDTSTFPIALGAAGYDFGIVCRDLAAHAADRG